MRSFLAGLRQLVLPWGAKADQPRMVLGPNVPPELTAFYATSDAASVVACLLWYHSSTLWRYEAITDKGFSARGVFESGVGVLEIDRYSKTEFGRGPKWELGKLSGAEVTIGWLNAPDQSNSLWKFIRSQVTVQDQSSLTIASDSSFIGMGYAHFIGGVDFDQAPAIDGRPAVSGTGAGLTHWQVGHWNGSAFVNIVTDVNGYATVGHTAGFTPAGVFVQQYGSSGTSPIHWIYVTGSATATTVQLRFWNASGAILASATVGAALLLTA